MATFETPDDIRREGLNALEERLSRAGMLRFLQQFERGRGDYAKDRHTWVDALTLDDVKSDLKKLRKKKAAPSRRGKQP